MRCANSKIGWDWGRSISPMRMGTVIIKHPLMYFIFFNETAKVKIALKNPLVLLFHKIDLRMYNFLYDNFGI